MVSKLFPIIGILVILSGLLFLGITIVLALRKHSRVKSWTKTMGVVVNIQSNQGMRQNFNTGSTRSTLYKPTVRFQTMDGRVIDYTPNTSNSWSNYAVGQNLEIYYDPQQPANAFFGGGGSLYLGFIIFGIVGVCFVLGGAIFTLITANIK